jgi:hypothetical protein
LPCRVTAATEATSRDRVSPPRLPSVGRGVLSPLVRSSAPRAPGGPEPDPGPILDRLALLYPRLSLPVRVLLPTALLALDLSPPLMGQGLRRFRSLGADERDACLRGWETSPLLPLRQLARVLVGLVTLAAWDDLDLQETIAYRVEEHIETVNRPREE